MREANFSFPSQNRASVCITSALYDRRALDCTAILPLINSLTHLTYLTSTSPRIREILTMDGGLERLVRILKTTKANDKRSGWKWSMAFQCVANVGVRGSEAIRTRVVEAGMVPVIITVLDNFLKALDQVRLEKEQQVQQQQVVIAAQLLSTDSPMISTASFVGTLETGNPSNLIQMSDDLEQPLTSYPRSPNATTTSISPASNTTLFIDAGHHSISPSSAAASTGRLLTAYEIRSSDDVRSDAASWGSVTDTDDASTGNGIPTINSTHRLSSPSINNNNNNTNINHSSNDSDQHPTPTVSSQSTILTFDIDILYREEDILLSLQLLAYLSKYPRLRATFHTSYLPHNVFSLVEKYTHRLHPPEIQYWAGVIMRNACRKDEARGGIRQCAYMACGKWENYAREFAKCRRCRKAKYCSKACQSKAWNEGHRWWCVERHGHGDSENHHPSQSNNQTTAAAATTTTTRTTTITRTATTVPPSTAITVTSTGGHRSRSANYTQLNDTRSGTNHETTGTSSNGTSSGTPTQLQHKLNRRI